MRPSLDFEKGLTRAAHMIGRAINEFVTRTRKTASAREGEFIRMS
jgi:hypothetical protein